MGHRAEDDRRRLRHGQPRDFCDAYAAALLAGDERAAELAIREAMDAGLSTAEIDHEVIAPALWRVGDLWEHGRISVADEHLATEISLRVLALQREAQRVVDARGAQRVMLATPAGELHVVALRMIANLLRDAGYDVVMIGADVPDYALVAAARRLAPDVVCLSATMPGGAEEVLKAMGEARRQPTVAGFVIGGRAVDRLPSGPDVAVCGRVPEAVEAVDAIVKRAGRN